jgi:hypothetical protein
MISVLPPSLTYAHFEEMFNMQWDLNTPLPQRLKHLSVPRLNIELLLMLPPSVEIIEVELFTLTEELAAALPRGLKSISATKHVIKSSDALQFLPSNLTSLSIVEFDLSRPTTTLPSNSSSFLPRTLRSLSIGPVTTPKGWFANLPKYLDKLFVKVFNMNGSDQRDLSKACPEIQELVVVVLDERPLSNSAKYFLDALQWGPRSLLSFSLEFLGKVHIHNHHLASLPPKLQILKIPLSGFLNASCLPHLPKSLCVLRTGNESPDWFQFRP